MMPHTTIVIPARNAEATIERAVRSALAQDSAPILLVDDFSSDATVERARAVAGARLRITRPRAHTTLGAVRQAGIAAVETDYGIWLDADDELLPGRLERMIGSLADRRADLAFDGVELFDGATGRLLSALCIPAFLQRRSPLARQFERNYLPGIGVHGFRTDFARAVGYDEEFHGGEDLDFTLRAIAGGARVDLLDSPGYRLHAYPRSQSRHIANQRRMCRAALLKHRYGAVRRIYGAAGYDARITAWGLWSMAMFRGDPSAALAFVEAAERLMESPLDILEPDGPCPRPEGWRVRFCKGTALLSLGTASAAARHLEAAESMLPTAEGANNLGLALLCAGSGEAARALFAASLKRFPGFRDARRNLEDPSAACVTTHPLRCGPARDDYAA